MTVSIVIPVFNEEQHLRACLTSVRDQSEPADEVIVVDNNSSDSSLEIASEFDFVKIIKEPKQGIVHARNCGFNSAKSQIIGRIDADSVMDKHWVSRLKQLMQDPEIMAVSGTFYYYDQPSRKTALLLDTAARQELSRRSRDFAMFFAGANMAIRAKAWHIVEPTTCRDNTMHEDWDLAIHLAQQELKVVFDRGLVVGTSTEMMDDPQQGFSAYLKKNIRTFKGHGLPTERVRMFVAFMYLIHQPLKVLRRFYNPATGRISLAKALDSYKITEKLTTGRRW
jgi:glycosyltransferase involved in cell wall biosynthesis